MACCVTEAQEARAVGQGVVKSIQPVLRTPPPTDKPNAGLTRLGGFGPRQSSTDGPETCHSNKVRRICVNVRLSHCRPRLKHYLEQEDTQTSVKLLRKMQSASVTQGMPALYEMCSIDKALHVMLGRGDTRSAPIPFRATSLGGRK